MAKRLLARVKELRKAKGLTQESFAEKAGLKYKYYQQVEAGRRVDIRFSTLLKLARACDLELWELLQLDAPLPGVSESTQAPYRAGPAAKPRTRKAAKAG